MNDNRPPQSDPGAQPGEPQGGWYGPGGAGDATQRFDRPNPYGTGQQYGAAALPSSNAPGNASGASGGQSSGPGSKGLLLGGIGLVAGILLGGAAGLAGGSAMSTDSAPTTVTETTTVETTVEVAAPPPEAPAEPAPPEDPAAPGGPAEGAGTIDGDGTYLVGADIEPGTYRSAGADTCYWARLSGTSGNFEEIIANNFGAGQQVVTIDPTDAAFETTMCGSWEKIS